MFALLGLLVIASMVLAACGGGAQAPAAVEPAAAADAPAAAATEAPAEEAASDDEAPLGSTLIGEIEGPEIVVDPAQFPTSFSEAPMLAEQVAAGTLPPLEERLPVATDLLVIQPLDEIGKYGGTWRRGFTGPGFVRDPSRVRRPTRPDRIRTRAVPDRSGRRSRGARPTRRPLRAKAVRAR